MDYDNAEPSVVKSIKQLDFLKTWLRLQAKQNSLAPAAPEYKPERIEEEKLDLVYYLVEWDQDLPRLRINSQGSRLALAYGKAGPENQGRYLDEYLDPDIAQDVLPIYYECIRRARPIYTVSTLADIHGHHVIYERLLLPFSDGTAVTEILASLKTISDDGAFEIKNLLRSADRRPVFKFRAVIGQGAEPGSSVTGASDDEVVDV